MGQIGQLTPSAVLGFLVVLLGYFIKKWICSLEQKLDRLGTMIEGKVDKSEFRSTLSAIERKCDRREDEIAALYKGLESKCDDDQFLRHSHTDGGRIVL